MLYGFMIVLFVLTCILMVVVILMQASKGGGLASSFGGMGGAGGMLSARSATSFLQKTTIGLAVFYAVLCIIISFMSAGGPAGQLESTTQQQLQQLNQEQQTAPAATELPAATPLDNQDTPPATDGAGQETDQGPAPEQEDNN